MKVVPDVPAPTGPAPVHMQRLRLDAIGAPEQGLAGRLGFRPRGKGPFPTGQLGNRIRRRDGQGGLEELCEGESHYDAASAGCC